MNHIDLSQLTADDLRPCLYQSFNTTILAQVPGHAPTQQTIALELSEVAELPAQRGPRASFALTFLGPPSTHHLPQRTYPLQHDHLGQMAIFLTPIGPAPERVNHQVRMRYQAIFN